MLKPFNDKVLVKLDERPREEKVGSIFVLDSAVERVWTGVVVALGQGAWNDARTRRVPIDLFIGQRVAFFRENFETQQGKQIAHLLEQYMPGHGLLRADSILYKWVD